MYKQYKIQVQDKTRKLDELRVLLLVIFFAAWNILRFVASLSRLVENCIERTSAKMGSVERVGACEERSAVVGRPVNVMSSFDWTSKSVTDTFRTVCGLHFHLVRVSTNSLGLVEDEGSSTSEARGNSSRAMVVLVARFCNFVDTILAKADATGLRRLE